MGERVGVRRGDRVLHDVTMLTCAIKFRPANSALARGGLDLPSFLFDLHSLRRKIPWNHFTLQPTHQETIIRSREQVFMENFRC